MKSSTGQPPRLRRAPWLPAVMVSAALSACGGGGGSASNHVGTSSSGTPGAPSTASISASAQMANALRTGDARGVSKDQVLSSLQSAFSDQQARYTDIKKALFDVNADGSLKAGSVTGLDWNPSRSSIYLNNLDALQSVTVLAGNWNYISDTTSTAGRSLALVGTMPAGSGRYAAFGGHPFGVPGNAAMDQFMTRVVSWLTGRTNLTGLKVVVAQQSSGMESATRSWLVAKAPGVSINGIATNPASQSDNRCDNAQLASCLQGADLLVIGQDLGTGYDGAIVIQAVAAAQARGVPVLYTHNGWSATDLTQRILASLRLADADTSSGNFYTGYGLKAYAPNTLPALPNSLGDVQTLLTKLEQGTFTTDWSGCVKTIGRTDCSGDATYMSEFGMVANGIRAQLRQLDADGTAIFGAAGYDFEKMLVLLGDKYRQDVAYASTFKKENGNTPFLRAYFSDMTSYMTRGYTSVAQNLGDFSALFPANQATISRTVTVSLPGTGTKDYASGLYVLPGRSVKLTRMDAGTGTVRFGLNMLRDTTHLFDHYNRPTQLASPRPKLLPGVPVTITNPYGGPIYLFVDATAGQPDVAVKVEGVVSHPILRDASDPAQVAAFNSELSTTPTNWVVVASDTLTLHSNLPNFRKSMIDTYSGVINYGGDVNKLLADTFTYTIKDTYELAGFNSSSGLLQLPATVTDFCVAKGWDCTGQQHRRDTMQHVISDVDALCGGGCAGNPYDQNWAFTPLGWGETHEVGHNLQRSRLNIYDGISTEVSNNIFPMHKRIHYNQVVGARVFNDRATIGSSQPLCTTSSQSVGACVFGIMKSAQGQANPGTVVYNAIWSDSSYGANNSERVMFYRQLAEYARYYRSSFSDGWELYTLLYLLERNFSNSSSNWAAVRSGYGFGTYAAYPSGISGNDFLVVACSYIIGRDMRPVFDLWGITYSAAADAQVSAHGLPAASKLFFPMDSLSAPGASVGAPVLVTGTATYPSGY